MAGYHTEWDLQNSHKKSLKSANKVLITYKQTHASQKAKKIVI